MNIVLIGIQGSGKGTLVDSLKQKLDFNLVSTGQLLRDEVATGSPLGQHIKQIQLSGKLVEIDIVMDVLTKNLKSNNKKITIFDGFPRDLQQAEAMKKICNVNLAIYLNLSKEVAMERMLTRLTCADCGSVYNSKRTKVKTCPACGGKLIKRLDDNINTINARFEGFYKDTYPLVEMYKKQNVLFEVDASGTPEEVAEICLRAINERNN